MRAEDTPRDFLRNSEFNPKRAETEFPNARRLTFGGLFVSHSGVDTVPIRVRIFLPVVFGRLPADGFFMHSGGSGGADSYKRLVQAALHWCDKFMVAISRHAVQNKWVRAEVEWALEHRRPILVARLDEFGWLDLIAEIKLPSQVRPDDRPREFDFNSDVKHAQKGFATALDELLIRFPRGGRERLE